MKKLPLPPLLIFTILLLSQSRMDTLVFNTKGYHELGIPYMQHYEPKDYNGRLGIQALVQGDNGLIYIGNGKGVMEFDGIDWRMIQLPNKGVIRI